MKRIFKTLFVAALVLAAFPAFASFEQPTNVTAVQIPCTGIEITWTAPADPNAIGYIIYRNSTAISSVLGGQTLSFSDTTTVPGTNYTYYVEAVYWEQNSIPSNTASATAPASCGTDIYCPLAPMPGRLLYDFSTPTAIATWSGSVAGSISIEDNAAAIPYPSTIAVSGLNGNIAKVKVTLKNISHTWPADFGVLLVSPAGQKVILMQAVGGGSSYPLNNVTVTLDDDAISTMTNAGTIVSGTYKPTTYGVKVYPSPAPVSPYSSTLSAFNGYSPTGVWSLYVVDNSSGDEGEIAGGWTLEITTDAVTTQKYVEVYDDGINRSPDTTSGWDDGLRFWFYPDHSSLPMDKYYRLTLVSYDNHTGASAPTNWTTYTTSEPDEPSEEYFLAFHNNVTGNFHSLSAFSGDFPDNQNYSIAVVDTVGTCVGGSCTTNLNDFYVNHKVKRPSPTECLGGRCNGVTPVCAAFDDTSISDGAVNGCVMDVSISATPASTVPGGIVTYIINVKNVGDFNCSGGGSWLQDVVPDGMTYVEGSESHSANIIIGHYYKALGGILVGTDGNLNWNMNNLVVGETAWAKFDLQVQSGSCPSATIENFASGTASEKGYLQPMFFDTVSTPCALEPEITTTANGSPNPALVNQQVTWIAAVPQTSCSSPFTYSWSGTDGLSGSGQSVTKTYATTGTKDATVTISATGCQTSEIVATPVTVNPIPSPLSLTCTATPSNIVEVGQAATTTATVTGGGGVPPYTYSWTSSPAASSATGQTSQIYHPLYNTVGMKNVNVTVTDSTTPIPKTGSCSSAVQLKVIAKPNFQEF